MSDTLRKDKNDKQFKEGLKKKCSTARYRCRCKRCVGKHGKLDKIAEKELKTEINSNGYYEGYGIIWDKQGEVCNGYCCTVRDFICDFEEIVNKYVIN